MTNNVFKVSDVFQDPDMVGHTEYRAIFETVLEAVLQDDAYEALDEDTELDFDQAEHMQGVLEEMRDLSAELVEDVAMRITKARLRN